MATFVLIHGAWHGAWCWDRVAPRLTAAGHRVTTPTLSGLGERRGAPGGQIGLETHVADVVDWLWFGDLTDVVLVAHSYAGVVAGGVLARARDRIARLVLLDAFLPASHQGMAQLGDDDPVYRTEYERDPDWRIPTPPLQALGVTDPADVAWAATRLTGQPVRTFLETLGPVDFAAVPDRLYVPCTPVAPPLQLSAARARADGWAVAELPAGHDAMITHPREVAELVTRAA